MLIKIIIFISLFLISFVGLAQQSKKLYTKTDKEIAEHYIKQLHEGILLVRLQTSQRKIDILNRTGNQADAERVRKAQFKTNQSIVKAFQENFIFCPVYFFYSNDSKHVINNQLDSITFLDSNLRAIPLLINSTSKYLTAEFGIIKADTIMQPVKQTDGPYHTEQEYTTYTGGTNMSFGALLIKSDRFIQLSHPFPFYTRTLSTLPILRRSHAKVVTMMNKELLDYYRLLNE